MQAHSPIKGPLPHRKEASSLGHSPEIAKQTGVKWGGENGKKNPNHCQFPLIYVYLDLPQSKIYTCLSIYHKLTKCSLLWKHWRHILQVT